MIVACDFTSVFSINSACRKLVAKGPNDNHLTAASLAYFLYHCNFELLLNEAVNEEYF